MDAWEPLVLAVLIAGAVGLAAVSTAAYRRRGAPGTTAFAVLATTLSSLALAVAGTLLVGSNGVLSGSGPSVYVPIAAVGSVGSIPWAVFVLRYTGRGGLLTRGRLGALAALGAIHVALMVAYLVAVPAGQLFPQSFDSVAVTAVFAASVSTLLATTGLYAAGALALFHTTHAYSHASAVTGGLLAVPALALALLWTFLPQVGLGHGRSAAGAAAGGTLLFTALCFGAVVRYDDAFGSTSTAAGPAGREAILARHSDAVFTIDAEHRIVETNAAARETFGLSSDDPLGEPIEAVLDARVEDLATDAPLGVNTVDDLWTESTVFVETAEGRRRFHAEVSDLTDERGRELGLVISLEDVTERALREQRIGILNRVLRHNLRNKLSIVRGHAEMVPDAGEELEEYAETIEAAATDLLALGERARDVERLLAVEEDAAARVEEVVGDVVAELRRDCDDVTVRLDVGEAATASIPWEALEFVTAELCENAAKHNDAADPHVTVQCDREGDWAEIHVLDNGPTLSDQELVAIDADAESPLEHGSGLGLWSVRWVVTAFGGQLAVEENEPRGSEVTLLLPIADEDDRDDGRSEERLAAEAALLAPD